MYAYIRVRAVYMCILCVCVVSDTRLAYVHTRELTLYTE